MTGLSEYSRDMSAWLSCELGLRPDEPKRRSHQPPTAEVMRLLGIPPSRWYQVVLEVDE